MIDTICKPRNYSLLMRDAADRAGRYLEALPERAVWPEFGAISKHRRGVRRLNMRRHCAASAKNVGYSCRLGAAQRRLDRVKCTCQVPER